MSDRLKRRWVPRYSLRTLFVVVTVLALIAALLGLWVRQQLAIRARALGHGNNLTRRDLEAQMRRHQANP